MLCCAAVSQIRLSPKSLATRSFPIEMINTVLNEETRELMDYHYILKNPKYQELYFNSYSKELGRLSQGLLGVVEGSNTIFFIKKADVPAE